MRIKNNYVIQKLDVPKRVTLANGRTFIAKYKYVSKSQLPANVILRTYRQGALPRGRRRRQVGRGLFSFI